jgi:hypothetical protein
MKDLTDTNNIARDEARRLNGRVDQPDFRGSGIFFTRCLCLLALIVCVEPAAGATKLDFWHSYVHQPSGVIHYSFQIANYKRGIFFGSCGPSTRSLQWEYDIDLAGPGPVYEKQQITVSSDAKPVEVVSGKVRIDQKRGEATIDLHVRSAAGKLSFLGNGTHRISKIK